MLTPDNANRRIIGGIGIITIAAMSLASHIFTKQGDNSAWLIASYFWLGFGFFVIGGLIAVSGLRAENTIDEEWLRTIQLISAISVLGASINAVLLSIGTWQRVALVVIAVISVLLNWVAGRSRLRRR